MDKVKGTSTSTLSDKDNNKDIKFLIEQYQVLSDRRISQNELFWNVPLTFLTAQSFLLILAFGGFSDVLWVQAAGAFISFIFGLLSIQVFERNRLMEVTDAEQLADIEKNLQMCGYKSMEIHQKQNMRKYLSGENVFRNLEKRNMVNFLSRGISSSLWKSGMWLASYISFILFLYNLLLYFDFFRIFISSLDKSAISIIVLMLAINWILFTIDYIYKSQPDVKMHHILIFRYGFVFVESIIIAIFIISNIALKRLSVLYYIVFIVCILLSYLGYYKIAHKKRKNKKQKIENNINTLILAGGAGERLQSVLNTEAKFIAIVSNKKTLIENTIVRNMDFSSKQIIITNENYIDAIENLPFLKSKFENSKKVPINSEILRIITEPENKGTGTAILNYIISSINEDKTKNPDYDPVIVIVPSDHIINDTSNYTHTVKKACDMARIFDNIYLLGILPSFPSTQYGYIIIKNSSMAVAEVEDFIEKPDPKKAKTLVQCGGVLWNSGIFIARRSILLNAFKQYCQESYNLFSKCKFNKDELEKLYENLKYSSFDKDILEKSENLFAIVALFDWIDVGDPTRLQSAMLEGLCFLHSNDK